MAPPKVNLEKGQVLSGKYEIAEPLGKGLITQAFRAYHKALLKDVVVKVLDPRVALDKALMRRLVSEIEAITKLEVHPNIAWVLDLDKDGIWVYFVTEYYPKSLRDLLKEKGKLEPEEAKAVALQVLKALEYAHSNGITHRDLRPENILLRENGGVVVADFGIGDVAREAVVKLKITHFMPSPAYLAPEQIRSPKSVDHRADLYSLGAVLYEMLAGEPPFTGDIRTVYSQKFLGKVKELVGVPEELARVVYRALEQDPRSRFQTAEEFAEALEPRIKRQVRWERVPVPLEVFGPGFKASWEEEVELDADAGVSLEGLRHPLVVKPEEEFEVELLGEGEGVIAGLEPSEGLELLSASFTELPARWKLRALGEGWREAKLSLKKDGEEVFRTGLTLKLLAAPHSSKKGLFRR